MAIVLVRLSDSREHALTSGVLKSPYYVAQGGTVPVIAKARGEPKDLGVQTSKRKSTL
jgi:hypothetical protein